MRSWLASDWFVGLLLFVAALVPRAFGHNAIVTVDEAYHWFDRVNVFLDAVRSGDFAATNIIGHPGVTTMWLGALGTLLRDALAGWGIVAPDGSALDRELVRLPVAIVTSLCIALAFPLLRRLLGRRVALLAALFWLADPFMVAHSQLLHLDALLTSFVMLALLCALVAYQGDHGGSPLHLGDHGGSPLRWRMWIASGVCGGLALLTKSPSIMLLPMIGLILVFDLRLAIGDFIKNRKRSARNQRTRESENREAHAHEFARVRANFLVTMSRRILLPFLVWIVVAVAVWFVLWPAAWVDPLGAAGRMLRQAEADGGSPHGWGNFFWGQAVSDPGPLFYPVALALRLTPWAMLGVVLLPIALWLRTKDERQTTKEQSIAILSSCQRVSKEGRTLLMLTIFILAFIAMMTVPPKKFDRYLLPVFPAIDILAAVGISRIYDLRFTIYDYFKNKEQRIKHKRRPEHSQREQSRHAVGIVLCSLFFILPGINLAWYHPYELAYYNQLFGGGVTAARLIPIGWGEGYEQVAAYINAQPNGRDRPVAAWFEPVLRPNLNTDVVPLAWIDKPGAVDYAMLYIDQIQRRDVPEAIDKLQKLKPVYTVRINGIDYAYVYQLPQPVSVPRPATFGDGIYLRGYDLNASKIQSSSALTLTLHWQATAPVDKDYTMFILVLNERGEKVGQADVPPGAPRSPTSTWQTGRYIDAVQTIPVQTDRLTGRYWIAIGVYDPQTSARLPLRADPIPGAPDDGPEALLLGTFQR